VIADDVGAAADFLEEYALRPPRAEPHQTSVDSPRWREIQTRLRDLAARLRRSTSVKVEFQDTDAQFLETQSSRLFRMHHWIRRGPALTPDSQMMGEASKLAAERLQVIATMVRSRKLS
jgi:hypothetical protein